MAKKKREYTTESVLEAYRIAADILETVNRGLWDMDPEHWTEKQVKKLFKYVDRVETNNGAIIKALIGAED